MANVSEPVPEEDRVTVRLKFLNDTQRDVEASLVENVGQFKRRYTIVIHTGGFLQLICCPSEKF